MHPKWAHLHVQILYRYKRSLHVCLHCVCSTSWRERSLPPGSERFWKPHPNLHGYATCKIAWTSMFHSCAPSTKKNIAPFPCTKGHFESAAAPWGPQYGLWSQRFPCSATGSGYPIHTNATWHPMTFWVESLHPGCGVLQDLRYTSFISLNFKA